MAALIFCSSITREQVKTLYDSNLFSKLTSEGWVHPDWMYMLKAVTKTADGRLVKELPKRSTNQR